MAVSPTSRPTMLLVTLAAVAVALVANAYTPLNSDMGWTLRFGRDAVEHGSIVTRNVLSFTEPDHPVVTYQWLYSVIAFLLHRAFGMAGIVVLKWAVLAATVVALGGAVASVAKHPLARFAALVGVVQLLPPAFLFARAQVVTLAALSFVVWAGLSGRKWALWACVPLLALWANCHGAFVAGVGVLTVLCAALWRESRKGGVPLELAPASLVAIPIAAGLATFLNPFGYRLHALAVALSFDPGRSLDHEWTPLWRMSSLAAGDIQALAAVALTGVLGFFFVPRKHLRVWAVFAVALVTPAAERHLRLVPVLVAPLLACALDGVMERLQRERAERLGRGVPLVAGVTALAAAALFATSFPASLRFTGFPSPNPAAAIEVMRANHLVGNVWNDFNWGGLLLWATPEVRVACDGRFDQAYSAGVRRAVIEFGNDGTDPLETLNRYGAEMVLLRRDHPAFAAIVPTFTLLFCDADACLASRRPDQIALAKRGLVLPSRPLFPEDFF